MATADTTTLPDGQTAVYAARLCDRLRRTALALGLTVLAVNALVWTGWLVELPDYCRLGLFQRPSRPNTAVSLLLAGLALALTTWTSLRTRRPRVQQSARHLTRACAFLLLLIGLLTVAEYGLNVDLGLDQLLVRHWHGPSQALRMSAAAAASAALLGTAFLLFEVRTPVLHWPAEWLTV